MFSSQRHDLEETALCRELLCTEQWGLFIPLVSVLQAISLPCPPFSTEYLQHQENSPFAPSICMMASAVALTATLLLLSSLVLCAFRCQCIPWPMCLSHLLCMAREHYGFVRGGCTHLKDLLHPPCPGSQCSAVLLALP